MPGYRLLIHRENRNQGYLQGYTWFRRTLTLVKSGFEFTLGFVALSLGHFEKTVTLAGV